MSLYKFEKLQHPLVLPDDNPWAPPKVPAVAMDALERRFGDTPLQVGEIVGVMTGYMQKTAVARFSHEKSNHIALGLNPSDAEADHRLLIDSPGKIGKLTRWVAETTTNAFAQKPVGNWVNPKVAFDAFGVNQFGLWDTEKMNYFEKRLPGRVFKELPVGASMHVHMKNESAHIRHRVQFVSRDEGGYYPNWLFVVRRRPVLDIFLPDEETRQPLGENAPIYIYKESGFGVALEMLQDVALRNSLSNFTENENMLRELLKKNSSIVQALGKVVDLAIKAPAGESKDVIPYNAHMVISRTRTDV